VEQGFLLKSFLNTEFVIPAICLRLRKAVFILAVLLYAAAGICASTESDNHYDIEPQMLLESILRSAPSGIGMVKHRVIVKVNDYILNLTGYTREELLGKSARMLYPTDEDSEYVGREKYRQIAERGTGSVETRWLCKDGSIRNVILSSTPLDPNNLSAGVTFTVLDITDRKSAEERFTKAFEASPVALIVTDLNTGKIFAANESFIRVFGFSREELIGRTTLELNIWPSLQARELIMPRLASGESKNELIQLHAKNGDKKHVRVFAEIVDWTGANVMLTSLIDETGWLKTQEMLRRRTYGFMLVLALLVIILLIMVFRLLKSLRQRDEAKTESESRRMVLDTLLNNLPVGVFMVEAGSGKPLVANLRAQELLGRGILPDATAHNLGEVYQAVLTDTDAPYPIEKMPILRGMSGETSYVDDMTVVRPDGTKTMLEVFGTPVCDQNGKVAASIVSFVDITDRRKAEHDLRDSQAKLSALFSSMTEMVVLHELIFDDQKQPVNYRVTDCNPAYTAVTGITKEAAVGRTGNEIYGTEEPPYLQEFSQVALSGEPFNYETYFAPMDKHFSISVVCPGKNLFATVTNDISAIRNSQTLIANKNRELENYLYIASHDLRTPLVNIQGFSRRLQKNVNAIKDFVVSSGADKALLDAILAITDQDVPKTLDFIFNNVDKMDAMLKGLLQVSRTSRMMMSITPVSMKMLIQKIIEAQSFQLTEINARVEISELIDCHGDAEMLSRAFSNLIANSVRYRVPERQLVIKIDSEAQFNKVIYRVSDNGIGIEQKYLTRIWDVFFRVNSSKSDAGEGLGLSIVKRIVEKNRGRVWAESEPGLGTAFFVELLQKKFTESDI